MKTKASPQLKAGLPADFLERLQEIVPDAVFPDVKASFSIQKPVTFRLNPLQDRAATLTTLREKGVLFDEVPWYSDAYTLADAAQVRDLDALSEAGQIYRQGLSSMLVSLIVDPQPGESILDACAAPGSKTSHMAALMANQGSIVAVERVKTRLYKLKEVLRQQCVENTTTKLLDVRRYQPEMGLFDRVLVDAPCSAEGRFRAKERASLAYWSLRKVREMLRKQRGIIQSAGKWVKPGGILVYATCTFAPEENERVVEWFLRKNAGTFVLEPIAGSWWESIATYPALSRWRKTEFPAEIKHCVRVLPTAITDGFFIAKFRKVGTV